MEKYSRGRRGAPAKGVVRETAARVQIPPSPPKIPIFRDFFFVKRGMVDCIHNGDWHHHLNHRGIFITIFYPSRFTTIWSNEKDFYKSII